MTLAASLTWKMKKNTLKYKSWLHILKKKPSKSGGSTLLSIAWTYYKNRSFQEDSDWASDNMIYAQDIYNRFIILPSMKTVRNHNITDDWIKRNDKRWWKFLPQRIIRDIFSNVESYPPISLDEPRGEWQRRSQVVLSLGSGIGMMKSRSPTSDSLPNSLQVYRKPGFSPGLRLYCTPLHPHSLPSTALTADYPTLLEVYYTTPSTPILSPWQPLTVDYPALLYNTTPSTPSPLDGHWLWTILSS